MKSKEAKEFNKAINALALELPEPVWNDLHFKWIELQNSLAASQLPQQTEVRTEYGMCPKCNGNGIVFGNDLTASTTETCNYCNGKKTVVTLSQLPQQGYSLQQIEDALSSSTNGWVKEKPKKDKEFVMITASYILGGWEYSTWQIKKIEHSGKWYYGLCEGNGEEWGAYEDLSARLYKVLPPPPKQ